jgi:hypothetical protein
MLPEMFEGQAGIAALGRTARAPPAFIVSELPGASRGNAPPVHRSKRRPRPEFGKLMHKQTASIQTQASAGVWKN